MNSTPGGYELTFADAVVAAPPYPGPWPGLDRGRFLSLDRNESTRPPAAPVRDAIRAYVDGVHAYPVGDDLTRDLAGYCAVPPGCVLPTSGSSQGIQLVLRALLPPGGTLLTATPGFPFYGHTAAVLGAEVHGVPFAEDLTFPYGPFADAAAGTRPDVIVVINPNNPTGSAVDVEFLDALAAEYRHVPVVIDEAYAEYTGVTCIPLIARRPNVIVLRSFSKAFAMAGLRLGYVVAAEPVVTQLAKLRNPTDVNALALVAGRAHLRHLDGMRRHVHETLHVAKPVLTDFLHERGVRHWPGPANFVVVDPGPAPGATDHLRGRGILVRPLVSPPAAGFLRITVGTPQEMGMVRDAYAAFLAGVPAVRR
jgi:histidinol-phosphate aminotransferase